MANGRKKLAVIGGGIFGIRAAIELSQSFDVDLFEGADDLMMGATYANHNRHHYGFHYPRSPETALQCIEGSKVFESVYRPALFWDFDNYYAIAKEDTQTNFEAYIEFALQMGLSFKEVTPPKKLFNQDKISGCLRVKEAVYDYKLLKKITLENIKSNQFEKHLNIHLKSRITKVKSVGPYQNYLYLNYAKVPLKYDFIVNATYSRYNKFCEWIEKPAREFQFNLQELVVIKIPGIEMIGLTVMDGLFPSLLPFGRSDEYLFAHAEESQLKRVIGFNNCGILSRANFVESNWEKIKYKSIEYLPILKSAEYVRSLFVDRVVDSKKSTTDERVSENTNHGDGCWSIFSAKVLTSVSNAQSLHRDLLKQI